MRKFHTTVYAGRGKKLINVYGKTESELEEKVNKIKADIEQGKNVSTSGSFEVWAKKWFDEQIQPQYESGYLKPQTIDAYKCSMQHLTGAFGKRKLYDIFLSEFQQFVNRLAKHNPNTGEPTSKKTIRDILQVWDRIIHYAELNSIMVPNFRKSDVINNGRPAVERTAITLSEQDMIIDTPHRAQIAAMIMLFAGLRKSEVGALKWENIDFNNNLIEVKNSVYFDKSRPVEKEGGKSKAATRVIPLMPILKDYLLKYKKEHFCKTGYVFLNTKGGLLSKSGWKKAWDSYMDELNIKYGYGGKKPKWRNTKYPFKIRRFTPHSLRHTFATILYLQGFNEINSMQILGHSDIKTTVNIYTDLKNFNIYSLSDEYKRRLKNEYLLAKD